MTGSLQKKNNTYYAVVRVPDGLGGTKQKWVNTGVRVTGNNKREANKRLREIVTELEEQKTLFLRDGFCRLDCKMAGAKEV